MRIKAAMVAALPEMLNYPPRRCHYLVTSFRRSFYRSRSDRSDPVGYYSLISASQFPTDRIKAHSNTFDRYGLDQ